MPRRLAVVVALTLAGLSAYHAHLRIGHTRQLNGASLDELTRGVAATPFQHRVLAPALLVMARRAAPDAPWSRLAWWLEALAFAAFAAGLWRWLADHLPPPAAALATLPAAGAVTFCLVTPLFKDWYYPWDTPALAAMTWLLRAVVLARWRAFYVLFPIATLNRETTCFVVVAVLLVHAGRMPRARLLAHLALQTAVWVAIKVAVSLTFADNPGPGAFETTLTGGAHDVGRSHWAVNLGWLAHPSNWPMLIALHGGLWLPLVLPSVRRALPEPVGRAVWILPIHALAMLPIGNVDEARLFGELAGLVVLAYTLALAHALRGGEGPT